MLGAMLLSIAFIVLDVLSVTAALNSVLPVGINPFWKLSFVFKCLTDSVVLDDFKTALDRLRAFKISRLGSFTIDTSDSRMKEHHETVQTSNNWDEPPNSGHAVPIGKLPPMPSPATDSTKFESNHYGAENVEDREYAGITRSASRDRDIEENGIQVLDHANADRHASNAHMLSHEPSHWPPRHESTDTGDIDLDYAMAVRQVTNDDSRLPHHVSKHGLTK